MSFSSRWNRLCLWVTLPLLMGLGSGCAGGGFELGLGIAEQRVPGSPIGGLLGGLGEVPIPIDVDIAAETAARDTGPATAVRLFDVHLRITRTEEPAGDTDDFGFIESAQIFVESARSDSALPRVQVGAIGDVPEGIRDFHFDTDTSVDLLPYIQEGAQLTSGARGTVPPDDVSFDGTTTLSIEVL